MLSLTAGMRYKYCECNVSFRYKWDAMINYIRYVLQEDPWSGTVFIFMNRRHSLLLPPSSKNKTDYKPKNMML